MPALLGWALTLVFVMAGWVLFRSPDFATAAGVLSSMAGGHGLGRVHIDNAPVMALAVLAVLVLPPSQDLALQYLRATPWIAVPLGAALVFLLLLVGGRVPNEFIYFQF
jgi:hypothetical protein